MSARKSPLNIIGVIQSPDADGGGPMSERHGRHAARPATREKRALTPARGILVAAAVGVILWLLVLLFVRVIG